MIQSNHEFYEWISTAEKQNTNKPFRNNKCTFHLSSQLLLISSMKPSTTIER